MHRFPSILAMLVAGLGSGCALPAGPAGDIAETLDPHFFRCEVQPIVVADCGFFACHGDPNRPYHVFAPNRLRLDVPEAMRGLALTDAETEANYRRSLGFVFVTPGYPEPLLIAKPLAERAGGSFHEGAERYGGVDVYDDPQARELEVLRAWANGESREASCTP